MTKTIEYRTGQTVEVMVDGERVKGILTEVIRLNGDGGGIVKINGRTHYSHMFIPEVRIGDDEKSITYAQNNGRGSKE